MQCLQRNHEPLRGSAVGCGKRVPLFLSRTGGDSSVPHAARGPNRSILSGIASEDRLAPTARSANITWSRDADEVFRLAGVQGERVWLQSPAPAAYVAWRQAGIAGWNGSRAAGRACCRRPDRLPDVGPLNTPNLLCVLVVDGRHHRRCAGAAPGRRGLSRNSEDTDVCSPRPGTASAGHGPDRVGGGRAGPGDPGRSRRGARRAAGAGAAGRPGKQATAKGGPWR